MSTYSHHNIKNQNQINRPGIVRTTETEPPAFPRPSSSIARSRLKNRLVSKHFNRNVHLPAPPTNNEEDEFRHRTQFDHFSSSEVGGNYQPSHQSFRSDFGSQQSIQFENSDVVESFGFRDENKLINQHQHRGISHTAEDNRVNHLHSKIIQSHSLYVPGYESTIPNVKNAAENASSESQENGSTIVLSSSFAHSVNSEAMHEAVTLILSGKKEFCYLKEIDPDDPYKLVLSLHETPSEIQSGRYITLSSNGIIRNCNGETDRVTLKQYLREYKIFYRLRQIPVIGQFRKWKFFLMMKKFALASRRKSRSSFLGPHLFILDKSLGAVILYAKSTSILLSDRETSYLSKLLLKITSPTYFEDLDNIELSRPPVSKNDLASAQNQNFSFTHDDLENFKICEISRKMSKEEMIFHILCCIVYYVEKRGDKKIADIMPQSLTESKFRHQTPIDMIASRESQRAKSYTYEKEARKNMKSKGKNEDRRVDEDGDENLTYTQRSANRLNCRRIACSVKVIDFIIRDHLYHAAESSLSAFAGELIRSRSGEVENRSRISIKLVFRDLRQDFGDSTCENEDEHIDTNVLSMYGIDSSLPPPENDDLDLELYPNKRKTIETAQNLIAEVFLSSRHDTSLIHHDMLCQIFHPIATELVDYSILDLISLDDDNSVHRLKNDIISLVEEDLISCEVTLADYSFLVDTYCRAAKTAHSLTAESVGSHSTEAISRILNDVDKENKALADLPSVIDCGTCCLNIKDAVSMVLRQVENLKKVYCEILPQIFVNKGEMLFQRVHAIKIALVKKFTTVEEYVEAIRIYNGAVECTSEVEHKLDYLNELKSIMSSHKIVFTDEMYGIDTTLKTEYQHYQESMINFEDGFEDNSKHFHKELLGRSKQIVLPIESIEASLSSDMFFSPESDADVVLSEVQRLETIFNDACAESDYINESQSLMKIFVFDGLQVERIQQQLSLQKSLWKAVRIVRKLLFYVMGTHFASIDCEPLHLKVKAIMKVISKLESQDHSPIKSWVEDSLSLLLSLFPLISHLKYSGLTEAHKSEIERVLSSPIFAQISAEECTCQGLIDLNALSKSYEIESIYNRSVCEKNISTQLIKMQESLSKKEIQIVQDRDISHRITNLAECSDFIEDLVIKTKIGLQSVHSKDKRDEYTLFYEKVTSWDKAIKWIILFQNEGLLLKSFYTNPKFARHVPHGMKYFNIIDESWRSLIKVGRSDNLLSSLMSSSRLKNLDVVNNAVSIAYDAVYSFLASQRRDCPRLYFLSDSQYFDMVCCSDTRLMFQRTLNALFPGLTSIMIGMNGDEGYVEGVVSDQEIVRFKTSCSCKDLIGSWVNDIDMTLLEHVHSDVNAFLTGERSIIEDARYPICSNQARLVGLEVKFWTSLKESFSNSRVSNQRDIQKMHLASIHDDIMVLNTISGMSKDPYQVQSISSMIICLIQFRDLVRRVFGSGTSTIDNYFEEHAFILECAVQKFYDSATSELSVRHLAVEQLYGFKYLGFSGANTSLVITPLTEKFFLAISSTFNRGFTQSAFLRGPKNGAQLDVLRAVTYSFGLELFTFDCGLMDAHSAEASIKRCINGTLTGRFHSCFINAEMLSEKSYSYLTQSLILSLYSLDEGGSVSKTGQSRLNDKESNLKNILNSSQPHFSICLSLPSISAAEFFPPSLRKYFRPVHVSSPDFIEVLTVYLESYGFESPQISCTRLSGFFDHLSCHCSIDRNILFRILVNVAIPEVGCKLVKVSSIDVPQQCYLVVKNVLKHLPLNLYDFLTSRNIQYACSTYLNIFFDPEINMLDFTHDASIACQNIVSALMDRKCTIVVGEVDSGKSSVIRQAIHDIERFENRSRKGASFGADGAKSFHSIAEDGMDGEGNIVGTSVLEMNNSSSTSVYEKTGKVPSKLYPHIINPTLFDGDIRSIDDASAKISWSFMASSYDDVRESSSTDYTTTSDENIASKINNKRHYGALDRFLYGITFDVNTEYIHFDIPNSMLLSQYVSVYSGNSPNRCNASLTSSGHKLIWECTEMRDLDPAIATSCSIVFLSNALYSAEDTLSIEVQQFVQAFDFRSPGEESVVCTPLLECVSECIDAFVRPFLRNEVFMRLKSVQSLSSVIRSFFRIASSMYAYVGLDISTIIHPLEVALVYDSGDRENTIVEKSFWSRATFSSIMAFACIWSFGNCSPEAQAAFEDIFTEMVEDFQRKILSWPTKDSACARKHPVFPASPSHPWCQYLIQRPDEEEVEVEWIHWRDHVQADLDRKSSTPCYCSVGDFYLGEIFMPTYQSEALLSLRDASMQNYCHSSPFSLAILGSGGVGKTSLLYTLGRRNHRNVSWKGVFNEASPAKMREWIQESINVSRSYVIEHNVESVGAIFIDDVSIECNGAFDTNNFSSELLRTLFNKESYYDFERGKWVQLQNVFLNFTGKLTGGPLNHRMIKNCTIFSVPEGDHIVDVFSSKLLSHFPSLKSDFAFDIANVSLKYFNKAFSSYSKLRYFADCVSTRKARALFERMAQAAEHFHVESSSDVCFLWKRIIADNNFGLLGSETVESVLNNLLEDSFCLKSNIKTILSKEAENARSKDASPKPIARSTLRPTIWNISGDFKSLVPNNNGILFEATPIDEVSSKYLPSIQSIYFKNFTIVDFESMSFWKSTKKCKEFLYMKGAPLALCFGPAQPVIGALVDSSCLLSRYNVFQIDVHNEHDLDTFLQQFSNQFIEFLSAHLENGSDAGTRNVDFLRKLENLQPLKCSIEVPGSDAFCWHVHVKQGDMLLSQSFWEFLQEVMQCKNEAIGRLLQKVCTKAESITENIQQYFIRFLASTKVVVSIGSLVIDDSDFITKVLAMTQSSVNLHICCFDVEVAMNETLLYHAFEDLDLSTRLSRAVSAIVSEVAACKEFRKLFQGELFQDSNYESGTYDMICKIYQSSIEERSSCIWDHYEAEFKKIYAKQDTEPPTQSSCTLHTTPRVEEKILKLANVVWSCVHIRYLPICKKRDGVMSAMIHKKLEDNALAPSITDVASIVYTYMHVLIDMSSITLPEGLVELSDALLLCGQAISSVRLDVCAIVLSLLCNGSVHVVGTSHVVAALLFQACGLLHRQCLYNLKRCDNLNIEDFVVLSDDRSDASISETENRSSPRSFQKSVLHLPHSDFANSQLASIIVLENHDAALADILLICMLQRGHTQSQDLFKPWAYFRRLSSNLNSSKNREQVATEINEDRTECSAHRSALESHWSDHRASIRLLVQSFSAMYAATEWLDLKVSEELATQLFKFMENLSFAQMSSTMTSVLKDLLDFSFRFLLVHLDESQVLILKMHMVCILAEPNPFVHTSILRQVFHLLMARTGTLGLHSSPSQNEEIIPTNYSFDVFYLVFSYLKNIDMSKQRMSISDTLNMFMDNSEAFEECANMYYPDKTIPIPDGKVDNIGWIGKVILVLVLKPIIIDEIVSDAILEITGWGVSSLPSRRLSSSNSNEDFDDDIGSRQYYANLVVNPSGAFDVPSDSLALVPYYLTRSHVLDEEDIVQLKGAHAIDLSFFSLNLKVAEEFVEKATLRSNGTFKVECGTRPALMESNKSMDDLTMTVQRTNFPSLSWWNYSHILNCAMLSIVRYHNELSSSLTGLRASVPKILVRCYWLLGLFHASVVVRLYPFSVSIGEDTLRNAVKLLLHLRVRSVHVPELLFSRLSTMVHQLYYQIYEVSVDSEYERCLVHALFENVFTEGATACDMSYYLLGLLPLPDSCDEASIEAFITDINYVISSGECIHVADFIGCTNGELYENHLRRVLAATASTSNDQKPTKQHLSRLEQWNLATPLTNLCPSLSLDCMTRIRNCLALVQSHLPQPIKTDREYDNSLLRSLCASYRKNSIRQAHGQSGENHLWHYLQLEVECFNASISSMHSSIASILNGNKFPSSCSSSLLEKLNKELVPEQWLNFSFEEHERDVPLKPWVRQLVLRRKMLYVWLTQRYPEYIYLHLLQNPEGFIYALKQAFAEKARKDYGDVLIDARILELPFTSGERHVEIAKIHADNMKPSHQSYSIVIAGVHLMNARWLESSYSLEFLNPSFASKLSQELYLKVSATCEDTFEDDDYQCPLYAVSDFPMPGCLNRSAHDGQIKKYQPLLHVSVPSQCPVIEWRKRSVTMHASPDWHIPHV